MYAHIVSRDYFRICLVSIYIFEFFVYLSLAICWAQMRKLVYSDVLYTYICMYLICIMNIKVITQCTSHFSISLSLV